MNAIALGMEHLTVSGMPPLDFIDLAAAAGLQSVSLGSALKDNPFGYAPWSLLEDAALRRAVRQRLADTGVALALGEACVIAPGVAAASGQRVIDLFAELGCPALMVLSMEPDHAREADEAHRLAELATAAGLTITWEYTRLRRRALPELAALVQSIRAAGQRAGVLFDPMHFVRGGGEAAVLEALPPGIITYVQVCDVPLVGTGDYMDEALHRRLPPGEGELPLPELFRALPQTAVYSVEVPQVPLALSGVPHLERVRAAAASCRALLDQAGLTG